MIQLTIDGVVVAHDIEHALALFEYDVRRQQGEPDEEMPKRVLDLLDKYQGRNDGAYVCVLPIPKGCEREWLEDE